VIGFVYAKDIILSAERQTIKALLRPPFFIPPNMKIQLLLNSFKKKKFHIAIVVDEYGGTAGLVTLEDILEELVGDIMDEYDQEKPIITKLKDDEYLLDGMCSVSELNQEFSLQIDKNEYDNLADLLYDKFNKVPHKNESYTFDNTVKFTIMNVKAQRIQTVKAKRIVQHEEHS
jgi:CBS domain containing-hemolysin-like protein